MSEKTIERLVKQMQTVADAATRAVPPDVTLMYQFVARIDNFSFGWAVAPSDWGWEPANLIITVKE